MISVIVPMYNARNYIGKCLDSIVNQSYRDLEIIVVDDGSTDGSGTVADEYASKDSRIKVIHGENQGLVSARKRGIAQATGDYVLFVDSDDYIDIRGIDELLELADAYDTDVVCATAVKRYDNGLDSTEQNLASNGFYSGSKIEELKRQLFCIDDYCSMAVLPYLVCKLWKRDLITRFVAGADERITIGEDVAIGFPAILSAKSIYIVDLPFYNYCQHQDSMMGSGGEDKEYQNAQILRDYLMGKVKELSLPSDMTESLEDGISRYYINQLFTRAYPKANSENNCEGLYPFLDKMPKRVIIYGAGEFGKAVYRYAKDKTEVVAWIDGNAPVLRAAGLDVITLDEYCKRAQSVTDDCDIVIAIFRVRTAASVTKLLTDRGIDYAKIHSLNFSKP